MLGPCSASGKAVQVGIEENASFLRFVHHLPFDSVFFLF
jgi:hypothetical protein